MQPKAQDCRTSQTPLVAQSAITTMTASLILPSVRVPAFCCFTMTEMESLATEPKRLTFKLKANCSASLLPITTTMEISIYTSHVQREATYCYATTVTTHSPT